MPDVATALIRNGDSKPDQIHNCGETPLQWACHNKMETVAAELISTGKSNPGHVQFINGNTALILACCNGMDDIAMKLIETGESKPWHMNRNCQVASFYGHSCFDSVVYNWWKTTPPPCWQKLIKRDVSSDDPSNLINFNPENDRYK